jgi:HD-GYP domain-containing protein (c-di-GMP phosphodiesterase class II)
VTRLSDLVRHHSLGNVQAFADGVSAATDFSSLSSLRGQPASRESEPSDWYEQAVQELAQIKRAIQTGQTWHVRTLAEIAAGLVHSLESSDKLVGTVLQGASIDHVIGNMVNVAVLGVKIAAGLGYETDSLKRVAFAGLVHDLGMLALPDTLVCKSDMLLNEERELLREHPQRGAQLLSDAGETYRWATGVVMQEQERWDGTGYPNRLKGDAIDEMALIIGLADVFDALTSPRPYRKTVVPHQALRALLTTDKTRFPHHLLKALIDQLSMYPLGTTVRLNTGETGVVSELNKKHPLRPILLVHQRNGSSWGLPAKTVDLSVSSAIHIVEVVPQAEVLIG